MFHTIPSAHDAFQRGIKKKLSMVCASSVFLIGVVFTPSHQRCVSKKKRMKKIVVVRVWSRFAIF
jgi:hypothetical protein